MPALRVAVDEEQRIASHPFSQIRKAQPIRDLGVVDLAGIVRRSLGLLQAGMRRAVLLGATPSASDDRAIRGRRSSAHRDET